MQQREDKAIIISCRDYRESDRLVRLLTLEHGPLTALARGAKRSVKRFGGILEPFSQLDVALTIHHQGLSILHSVDNGNCHPTLRHDLERFAQAGYACELADRFLPEHLPNQRLFRLLASYLEHLALAELHQLPSGRRFFEINLLNILGYRPDLAAQVNTGLISPATADLLAHCLATGRIGTISFPVSALAEAGSLLDLTLASYLDRPLKSLEFLNEISNSQND